ncbi:salivary glue protein Sgs-3-like [Daphnia magna]|uniref:salivary glue protein Sgs-3-like n=1 Tax=Daphnia magna TaxID=35525 RepID=UPI001E1BCEF0|nr:salivary glue protein Sgs-3-like [Daphnia magna]
MARRGLPNEVNVTIDGSRLNSNSYWLVKDPEDYGVPTVVLSGDESNSNETLSDTRELKDGPSETLATTTLSKTPTTPSPNSTPRIARPPSHIKSTSLTTPVTKRPSNRNPSTRVPSTTIRPHTRRPTAQLSRPTTTTKRPATTKKRPATTSKRPTTRAPITKNSMTKKPCYETANEPSSASYPQNSGNACSLDYDPPSS